jgi:hypothetical protein
MLPAAVYPVAALARSPNAATAAHALERAVDGRWVKIEAAPLDGERDECADIDELDDRGDQTISASDAAGWSTLMCLPNGPSRGP